MQLLKTSNVKCRIKGGDVLSRVLSATIRLSARELLGLVEIERVIVGEGKVFEMYTLHSIALEGENYIIDMIPLEEDLRGKYL